MENIYGFNQKDVVKFIEFIKGKENLRKSDIFREFSYISGKSIGTVRNLYYTLSKISNKDVEFNKKFDIKPIKVKSILPFNSMEEEKLVAEILKAKSQGVSVRSTVNKLADYDGKLALRFQNKYRSLLKSNPKLIEKVKTNLGLNEDKSEEFFNEFQIKRVKSEINKLFLSIKKDAEKENLYLKHKIELLEAENNSLKRQIFFNGEKSAKQFFSKNNNKNILS